MAEFNLGQAIEMGNLDGEPWQKPSEPLTVGAPAASSCIVLSLPLVLRGAEVK